MSNFWRGKRVFLTGHTGFKGGWLALWLTMLGAEVYGFGLSPTTQSNLFTQANVQGQIKDSCIGDIRNQQALASAFEKADPQIVIHMAAQSLVLTGYESPVETYEVNILGTLYLLEAVRHADNVQVFLNITTDKCYDSHCTESYPTGFTEDAPLGGRDPYASSKVCSEWISQTYQAAFLGSNNIRSATARAGNIIGGGDWSPNRLIPDLVNAVINKETLQLRYPEAVRPWQHVLDALQGYQLLIEALWDKKVPSSSWNFGPTQEKDADISVMALVNEFKVLWEPDLACEILHLPQRPETNILRLNPQKATETLRWLPQLTTTKAIEWTIEWYKEFYQGRNAAALVQQQIEQFQCLQINEPSYA